LMRDELRLTRKANIEFARKCKLVQSNLKEVIKMNGDDPRNKPEQTRMSVARETLTEQLAILEEQLKELRAKRNVVARALKGLGRFY